MPKIVCVTACPTGIAHTYLAAEILKVTGKALGYTMLVETHGAIGIENKLTTKDIKDSIGVIIAADIYIDKQRFVNKHVVEVTTKEAIHSAIEIINKIAIKQ